MKVEKIELGNRYIIMNCEDNKCLCGQYGTAKEIVRNNDRDDVIIKLSDNVETQVSADALSSLTISADSCLKIHEIKKELCERKYAFIPIVESILKTLKARQLIDFNYEIDYDNKSIVILGKNEQKEYENYSFPIVYNC